MANFQVSQDSGYNWANNNRAPLDFELARESDRRSFRIGDGSTPFSGLRPHQPSMSPEFFNVSHETLRFLRMTLAKARGGRLGQETVSAPLIVMGASIDIGVHGWDIPTSYPMLACHSLWSGGIPMGGTGWVPAWNNGYDPRWTTTGFPLVGSSVSLVRPSNAAGQHMIFVSDAPGDKVQIATLASPGGFTVTIDGVSQTIPGPTTTSGISVYTWSGFAKVPHTVDIASTTATSVNLVAARVSRTDGGLELTNWGISGGQSSAMLSTGSAGTPGQLLPVLFGASNNPGGLVVLGLDPVYNDGLQANGVPQIAATKANYSSIITSAQSYGHQVMLTLPPQPNPAAIPADTWAQFRQAAYQLAVQYEVPLLDMTWRWKDYASGVAAGFFFDDIHPTTYGYNDFAAAFGELLRTGLDAGGFYSDPGPQKLTLANGFTAFNLSTYATPTYHKTASGLVSLSGLLTVPASPVSKVIANIPQGSRPGTTHRFPVICAVPGTPGSNTMSYVDVTSAGDIITDSTALVAGNYVSLSGITYPAQQ